MVRELNLYVDGVATVSVAPPDVADRDELRALFDAACPGSAHEKDRASGVKNFWTMHTRSGRRVADKLAELGSERSVKSEV